MDITSIQTILQIVTVCVAILHALVFGFLKKDAVVDAVAPARPNRSPRRSTTQIKQKLEVLHGDVAGRLVLLETQIQNLSPAPTARSTDTTHPALTHLDLPQSP